MNGNSTRKKNKTTSPPPLRTCSQRWYRKLSHAQEFMYTSMHTRESSPVCCKELLHQVTEERGKRPPVKSGTTSDSTAVDLSKPQKINRDYVQHVPRYVRSLLSTPAISSPMPQRFLSPRRKDSRRSPERNTYSRVNTEQVVNQTGKPSSPIISGSTRAATTTSSVASGPIGVAPPRPRTASSAATTAAATAAATAAVAGRGFDRIAACAVVLLLRIRGGEDAVGLRHEPEAVGGSVGLVLVCSARANTRHAGGAGREGWGKEV